MRKSTLIFLLMLAAGIILRVMAMRQLDWFMGTTLHVDEITYSMGGSPPFERPPGTYLASAVTGRVVVARTVFSVISLLPALAFFLFRERKFTNGLLAGTLAVEPTLAFSGLQVLPSAPAAAFLSLSLIFFERERHLLAGWLAGCAALFRGELLLLLPVSLAFIGPGRRWLRAAFGILAAVVPLMTVNLISGGPFAPAENGPLNLWLGTSAKLLSVPPGIEYEELVGAGDFAGRALDTVLASPLEWVGFGASKVAAFLSVPGPGRNLESPVLIGETVLVFMLPVTAILLSLALTGFRRDWPSALTFSGLLAAFLFFPSIRHRAVYLPAMVIMAAGYRKKLVLPAAGLVLGLTLFFKYPAEVRPGLTQVQHAQDLLQDGEYTEALHFLAAAEGKGYAGADLHSIRGACIASSGGDFSDAIAEFSRALEIAPDSPTAWKNMAAVLWNYGYNEDAAYAARKAVSLNPELREELTPVLSTGPSF